VPKPGLQPRVEKELRLAKNIMLLGSVNVLFGSAQRELFHRGVWDS
jgi:hypothetical protein